MNKVFAIGIPVLFGLIACVSKRPSYNQSPQYRNLGTWEEKTLDQRTNALQEPRRRLMVLPFIDESGMYDTRTLETARQVVLRDLVRSRGYLIINNSDLPTPPSDYLSPKGYEMDAVLAMAKDFGVGAVVEGKVLEMRARKLSDPVGVVRQVEAHVEATIQVRVFGSRNGRELFNQTRSGQLVSATTQWAQTPRSDELLLQDPSLVEGVIYQAFHKIVAPMILSIKKLNWEGRVAHVSNEKIYVNAGQLSGIQIGDILKVMEEGDEVVDPISGTLIGRTEGRIKGTIEVISYFGKDGAVGVIHSGAGFRENDRVVLY